MALKSGLLMTILLFTAPMVHAQLYEQVEIYPASAFEKMDLKYPANRQPAALEISPNRSYYVFVFLSPECPLSQQYTLSLNELAKKYQRQLSVIGIFPGKSYDSETLNAFLRKYKISFGTFIDESKMLSNYMKASVTPEVILVSNSENKLTVEYRGAIDDRVKELGVKRLKAGNFFLKDAVDQCLENKEVVIKRTDPVGCLINDY